MARKEIKGPINDQTLNNTNSNFIELYKEYIEAGLNAADAREKATRAVADSTIAKDTAETTREEMLAIIREQTQNGDLAPEIAQARGGEATLGERFNSVDSQLAQTNYKTVVAKESLPNIPKTYLNIPTYDDIPSVTHPDVVFIPESWNGYRYWMAFTPYPDGARENPSIVASNNGSDWEVPTGLVNPLVTLGDAINLGHTYWSDTDIVLLPSNELAVYFRGYSKTEEKIYRMVSSNGFDWEGPIRVLTVNSNDGTSILSPAVIVDDDKFVMYSINDSKQNHEKLEKRESQDGVNWENPVTCVIPSGVKAWHVDAVKSQSKYHLLVASDYTGTNGRLYYWTSSDGVEFEGDSTPSIPLSGMRTDNLGHYRSTFVPIEGNPLKFKVWVAAWRTFEDYWNIIYYDGITLENNAFRSEKKVDFFAKEHENIFIPAKSFSKVSGDPVETIVQSRNFGWRLKETGTHQLSASVRVPKDWKNVRLYILWSNRSNNTGDAVFRAWVGARRDGEFLGSGLNEITDVRKTGTAREINVLNKTYLWTRPAGHILKGSVMEHVRLMREADDSLDTLDGEVTFLGVVLVKRDVADNKDI